jgi:(5-formylfuran-3-yl)methyl phosphate synthase
MTLFLASVASAAEALTAVAQGADIIDAKDAGGSGLAALAPAKVHEIVGAVAARRPVSTVVGDLPMIPEAITQGVGALLGTGVETIKVGFMPHPQGADCIRALGVFSGQIKIVGVLFADLGPDYGWLRVMREAGFAGAMLDTCRKEGGRLIDHIEVAGLRQFIAQCRAQRLWAGLAGSLEPPDVPRLLLLEPDLLGFRGALCVKANRRSTLDQARVQLIRELIPLDPRSSAYEALKSPVDYRLLAAGGYAMDPAKDPTAADRIFVHDLVLPVRIGAYAHERERAQRVRFNVDAEVVRSSRAAEDMRDVVSYDLISDAVLMLAADEHILLLETLAERIAALVLSRDRVLRVRVRVEKLDLGPGEVGIEITREPAPEVAKVHQLYPAAADIDPKAAE